MARNSLKKRQRGWTLVEVVMSVVVLSVCLATLAYIQGQLVYQTAVPEAINKAVYLAEKEYERVSNLSFSAVSDEAETAYTGDYSDFSYTVDTTGTIPTAICDTSWTCGGTCPFDPCSGSCPCSDHYKIVDITISHSTFGELSSLTTMVTNHEA